MCGIAGAIWTDPDLAVDEEVIRRMADQVTHRGPDDQGLYRTDLRIRAPLESLPGVGLGFRRLSIIDVAGGHQPIANEDESVWMVFNGEVYNFPELRHRLEGSGHRFRTRCDSEAIVHLYEDEGPDCFQHLNGMFAVAIWDRNDRRLVLGRDRLGQKPLVYHHQPGRLLFASQLKSLLEVPDIPRDIDASAIDEYLTYQYIPHPNTIFRGIKKLPPGHRAVFHDGKVHVDAYWQPRFDIERRTTESTAVETLRELLESSVQMRMQSDVPLGAFLSGGVDSSLIVALMQQHSETPVKTFSIGFPVAEYDESDYARQVAEHLGTEHHAFEVTPDAVEVLPELVWHYDEPFADSSAIPTWYVSRQTREHVTVALSGDGGDELFAGYPRYRAVRLGAMLDRSGPLRAVLASNMWQWLPSSPRQKSLLRRLKKFTASLAVSPRRRYLDWIAIFNEERRAELYSDEFLERLPASDPFLFLQSAWNRVGNRDPVTCASLADLVTYLPCDLMTKVDVASMAHSLECRQPFLDHRLVEWAAALPVNWKFRRGRGKWLLQRAFGDLLPDAIWKRPKMGFGVPLDHWFRDELREMTHDTLLAPGARCADFFRSDTIAELVAEHEQRKFDHAYRLWALLVLELWLRRWLSPTASTSAVGRASTS